jgi:hypothetical protein
MRAEGVEKFGGEGEAKLGAKRARPTQSLEEVMRA